MTARRLAAIGAVRPRRLSVRELIDVQIARACTIFESCDPDDGAARADLHAAIERLLTLRARGSRRDAERIETVVTTLREMYSARRKLAAVRCVRGKR